MYEKLDLVKGRPGVWVLSKKKFTFEITGGADIPILMSFPAIPDQFPDISPSKTLGPPPLITNPAAGFTLKFIAPRAPLSNLEK